MPQQQPNTASSGLDDEIIIDVEMTSDELSKINKVRRDNELMAALVFMKNCCLQYCAVYISILSQLENN